jgi:predicted amidohydrolase YtcJ
VGNKKTFEVAGLLTEDGRLRNDVSTEGGAVDTTPDRFPTGIVRERACEPIVAAFAKYKTYEQSKRFLEEGMDLCLQNGITSVHTNDEGCVIPYQKLEKERLIPIRIFLTPNYAELHQVINETGGPLKDISAETRLIMDRVKIFSDGSLGAETAALNKADSSSYTGILIHTKEKLKSMISEITDLGFRVEIHAIGDAAADQVVDCIHDVAVLERKEVFRPLLTHCQVLSAHSVGRMKDFNVIANVQPSFVATGELLLITPHFAMFLLLNSLQI